MLKVSKKTKLFDPSFVGVQIWWEEDDEIEYVGPAALRGEATHIAASCSRGKGRIHYLYPVEIRVSASSRTREISYHKNPAGWPKGWELEEGDLIIEFDPDGKTPLTLSYRFSDGGETVRLEKGADWIYQSPTAAVGEEITVRGKSYTLRIDRPNQSRLRNQLLAEVGRCQLTGTETADVLEACHIVPVRNGGSDVIANALLLRSDLHVLFDMGLIAFHPSDSGWVVGKIAESVTDQLYKLLFSAPLHGVGAEHGPYLTHRLALQPAGNG